MEENKKLTTSEKLEVLKIKKKELLEVAAKEKKELKLKQLEAKNQKKIVLNNVSNVLKSIQTAIYLYNRMNNAQKLESNIIEKIRKSINLE